MNKKKINLFNSVQRFRDGFVRGCKKNKIKLNILRTRNTIIHLENGKPAKFIHKNEEVDIHGSYNFFQLRGKEGLVPALIALYCKRKKIKYNDDINYHHTENVNKISQMMMLWLKKLPIPGTIILSGFSYEKNQDYIEDQIKFPIVLKKNGDRGSEVWKIKDLKELNKRLLLSKTKKLKAIKAGVIEMFILQEYIPNTHDFRVTMFEHEVLGVIKRISKDGFFNNWSRGASWEVSEISKKEEKLSQRACDACGIDVGGVDFVRTEKGILFFEVKKSPQMNLKYPEIIVKRLNDKDGGSDE